MARGGKTRSWRSTGVPPDSALTEDIWFADLQVGWAVNSNGQILRTEDAGETWQEQAHFPELYLRCISFAGRKFGWVGTVTPEHRVFHTRDGGLNWEEIDNLPAEAPRRIAAICAPQKHIVVISGTTYREEAACIARSGNGGASWTTVDLSGYAATLRDMYFADPLNGWVVGAANIERDHRGDNLVPAILCTNDGGLSWRHSLSPSDARREFPRGEVASKITSAGPNTLLVSLENPRDGAIARSDDGGISWRRMPVGGLQRNLDGIGFLDTDHGWVSGSGDFTFVGGHTSVTSDGGVSWHVADNAAHRFSRFRFIGHRPAGGYGAGDTIYKLAESASVLPATSAMRVLRAIESTSAASFNFVVPAGAHELAVVCWERAGRIVRVILREQRPRSGARTAVWDLTDDQGSVVPAGTYIVRITIDHRSESRMLFKAA